MPTLITHAKVKVCKGWVNEVNEALAPLAWLSYLAGDCSCLWRRSQHNHLAGLEF